MTGTAATLYDLTFVDNRGQEVDLQQFEGRPVLVVNTASKCGFTPQYDGLEELHEKFQEQGLVVIGFPCDQFGHQEPGDDEQIEEFCRINHGVTFPLSSKVSVNGSDTHPVFAFLKDRAGGLLGSRIKWNFTKFLVMPDGRTVKRYAPNVTPDKIEGDIVAALAEEPVR
jgi:glutathione peroxidase